MSGLDLERAMVAALCVGMAERALELALDYAKLRQQFGKAIASFQMVQSKLAEIYVAPAGCWRSVPERRRCASLSSPASC